MAKTTVKDIVDDILLNATDYIGNDPEYFDADNKALDTIRNNKQFRAHMEKKVKDSFPEEYQDCIDNQKKAAHYVWKAYVSWAYGPYVIG